MLQLVLAALAVGQSIGSALFAFQSCLLLLVVVQDTFDLLGGQRLQSQRHSVDGRSLVGVVKFAILKDQLEILIEIFWLVVIAGHKLLSYGGQIHGSGHLG